MAVNYRAIFLIRMINESNLFRVPFACLAGKNTAENLPAKRRDSGCAVREKGLGSSFFMQNATRVYILHKTGRRFCI